jgi:hypothetical protein
MAAERKHIDSATKATKMGYGMEDGRMKNEVSNESGRNRQ